MKSKALDLRKFSFNEVRGKERDSLQAGQELIAMLKEPKEQMEGGEKKRGRRAREVGNPSRWTINNNLIKQHTRAGVLDLRNAAIREHDDALKPRGTRPTHS